MLGPMPPRVRAGPVDDAERFSGPRLVALQQAAQDAAWLIDRGYPREKLLDLTGDRHALDARHRLALHRGLCTADQVQARQARRREVMTDRALWLDGLNLLITLEVALAGGVLVRGRDGVVRDLAGVRGTYDVVEQSEPALHLLDRTLESLGVAEVHWLLDAPVGRSGDLARRLRTRPWSCRCTVDLVPDPDRDLAGRDAVVSSDARVLDQCASWVDLLGPWQRAVQAWIVQPWVVEPRPDLPVDATADAPALHPREPPDVTKAET